MLKQSHTKAETWSLSVFRKMHTVQFTLDTFFNILFFNNIYILEGSSIFYDIYLICDILLLWKPMKHFHEINSFRIISFLL